MGRFGWLIWAALVALGLAILGLLYVTAPIPEVTSLLAPVAEKFRSMLGAALGVPERQAAVLPLIRAAQSDGMQDPDGHAAAFLAILARESNYYPDAYNYADGTNLLGKTIYRSARRSERPETNEREPWAVGLCQIIRPNRDQWGLSLDDAFDGAANIAAWLDHAGGEHWRRIMRGAGSAPLVARAALLYMGHGAGGGPMDAAISVVGAGGSWRAACDAVGQRFPKYQGGAGGVNINNMWSHAQAADALLERIHEWEGTA